jgi:cytochrome c peroxidase
MGKSFFWDGRAKTLEEQALGPIQSDVEMAMPLDMLVARLEKVAGYQQMFNVAFTDGITSKNISNAIATFERTVVSGQAPFDNWIDGDETAISEQAKKGFALFNGKGNCATCHTGWNFTDNKFHDIGLADDDLGRYEIDSSTHKNQHAFKTPSLRNIAQRAPYMHNGSIPDLFGVVVHYITGGIPRNSLSENMKSVPLTTEEIDQLIAFLQTLQGEDSDMPLPILPL